MCGWQGKEGHGLLAYYYTLRHTYGSEILKYGEKPGLIYLLQVCGLHVCILTFTYVCAMCRYAYICEEVPN